MRGAVVCVIKDSQNRILLLSRSFSPFGWGLPGGKIENGETLMTAVIREVKEETGIVLNADELDWVKSSSSVNGRDVDIYLKTTKEDKQVTLSPEHSEFKWVTEKELKELNLAGNTKEFLNF